MTCTVERKPITQAMQLALWKRDGIVFCDQCRALCRARGVAITPFHWDHYLALVDGGAHDVENIRPVCIDCHREKSAREHKNNAKAKRNAKKHSNPKPPGKIKSRGFDKRQTKKFNGDVVPRTPATAET